MFLHFLMQDQGKRNRRFDLWGHFLFVLSHSRLLYSKDVEMRWNVSTKSNERGTDRNWRERAKALCDIHRSALSLLYRPCLFSLRRGAHSLDFPLLKNLPSTCSPGVSVDTQFSWTATFSDILRTERKESSPAVFIGSSSCRKSRSKFLRAVPHEKFLPTDS